jgi:hypothetical protein
MRQKAIFSIVVTLLVLSGSLFTPKAVMQDERTLAGEWTMVSSPINNEFGSRMGNTLGFPNRDMRFEQEGDILTGVVLREDVGPDAKPLGVWRVMGESFSASFMLWCPETDIPCGSVVMRGEFVNNNRVRGTMTVFFDEADETRPTGYDTWVFSFTGTRR